MDEERPPNQPDPESGGPTERRGSIVSTGPTTWPAETRVEAPRDAQPSPAVTWVAPAIRGRAIDLGRGLVLAGMGTRVAAFLVDSFVLAAASIITSVVAGGLIADQRLADLVASIVSTVLGVGYFAVAWIGPWAATPGQRLGGMRVVDITTLEPIDLRRALIRSLVLGSGLGVLSGAVPLSQLVGAIFIVWPFVLLISAILDNHRQGLHDRLTRTIVVRPAEAGSRPLMIGCFLMVLIVLAAPFVISTAAGPAFQQLLKQSPGPSLQP